MTPAFWQRIEASKNDEGDRALQATTLTDQLAALGVDAIVEFSRGFDSAMDHLFTWELWGAAYLAMGGCGDDMFEYFRAWLIADGEATTILSGAEPESMLRVLLADWDDPDERWEDLRVHQGENILYAAGLAHERLTGEWLPPSPDPRRSDPTGVAWEEDELPRLYPDLAASLPGDWWGEATEPGPIAEVRVQARSGIDAFAEGDHATALDLLEPLVEDPVNWELLSALGRDWRTDAAYGVGISRLLRGDVAGSADALRLVVGDLDDYPHIRRALAQVELARGELDSAAALIDFEPGANRYERALAAKVAFRRGDRDEALRRSLAEIEMPIEEDEHPWDVAGSYQQFGQILVDLGAAEEAETMARAIGTLLRGAPDDLPLIGHLRIVLVGIVRLQGRLEAALEAADDLVADLEGSDQAEALRERARVGSSMGNDQTASDDFRRATELFDRAGETWEAQRTRSEASAGGFSTS